MLQLPSMSAGGHGARELVARMERSAIRVLQRCRAAPALRFAPCGLQGIALTQKKIGPCLRLWARGSPSFRSFRFPPQGEGLARRQGAWPGLRQTGPGVRGSRAGPDRRALGVKRHAPRLAARQRGIFAFVPLTVVGPGRLLVAGEAARARPGDDGCVLRRPQVPLPFPANKTPPEGALVEWIGMAET